ncbi:hypothetical protein SEUBUCD646_0C00770 [Saccharomyces eubayanus]|nr:hypothetical protein SEUBUCD646_0C00770 [Saccharomyces eubayanus]
MNDIEAKVDTTPSTAQGEYCTSKAIWVLKKISILVFIYFVILFQLAPDLQYLGSKYPMFSGYSGYVQSSSLVLALLSGIFYFSCIFNPTLNREKEDPLKLPETDCLKNDMTKNHPRRIYWLLFSLMISGAFFAIKIRDFFRNDQTIYARRLLQLLGWDVGYLGNFFVFYQIASKVI